jgi:hypothetical protein
LLGELEVGGSTRCRASEGRDGKVVGRRSQVLGAGRDGLLVLVTGKAHVVGIVDPFDARQPNQAIPPQDYAQLAANAVPFALSTPSVTETLRFAPEDMQPAQARTQAFFARLGGFGGGGLGGGVFGADGNTRTQIGTQTVWHHGGWTPGGISWVEYDEKADEITDDYIA